MQTLLPNLSQSVTCRSSPSRAQRGSCSTCAVGRTIGLWTLAFLAPRAVGLTGPIHTPWFRTLKLALSLGSSSVRAAGPRCVPWPWPRVWFPCNQTSLPLLLARLPFLLERKRTNLPSCDGRTGVGWQVDPLIFPCVCVWVVLFSSVPSMTFKLLQASPCWHSARECQACG